MPRTVKRLSISNHNSPDAALLVINKAFMVFGVYCCSHFGESRAPNCTQMSDREIEIFELTMSLPQTFYFLVFYTIIQSYNCNVLPQFPSHHETVVGHLLKTLAIGNNISYSTIQHHTPEGCLCPVALCISTLRIGAITRS